MSKNKFDEQLFNNFVQLILEMHIKIRAPSLQQNGSIIAPNLTQINDNMSKVREKLNQIYKLILQTIPNQSYKSLQSILQKNHIIIPKNQKDVKKQLPIEMISMNKSECQEFLKNLAKLHLNNLLQMYIATNQNLQYIYSQKDMIVSQQLEQQHQNQNQQTESFQQQTIIKPDYQLNLFQRRKKDHKITNSASHWKNVQLSIDASKQLLQISYLNKIKHIELAKYQFEWIDQRNNYFCFKMILRTQKNNNENNQQQTSASKVFGCRDKKESFALFNFILSTQKKQAQIQDKKNIQQPSQIITKKYQHNTDINSNRNSIFEDEEPTSSNSPVLINPVSRFLVHQNSNFSASGIKNIQTQENKNNANADLEVENLLKQIPIQIDGMFMVDDFQLVKFCDSLQIMHHIQNSQILKVIFTVPFNPSQIVQQLYDIKSIPFWNNEIQIIEFIHDDSNSTDKDIKQINFLSQTMKETRKSHGLLYKPRQFIYDRTAFIKNDVYYIIDKKHTALAINKGDIMSIKSSLSSSTIIGEFVYQVFAIKKHPSLSQQALMAIQINCTNCGLVTSSQDQNMNLDYLKQYGNFKQYLLQQDFHQQPSFCNVDLIPVIGENSKSNINSNKNSETKNKIQQRSLSYVPQRVRLINEDDDISLTDDASQFYSQDEQYTDFHNELPYSHIKSATNSSFEIEFAGELKSAQECNKRLEIKNDSSNQTDLQQQPIQIASNNSSFESFSQDNNHSPIINMNVAYSSKISAFLDIEFAKEVQITFYQEKTDQPTLQRQLQFLRKNYQTQLCIVQEFKQQNGIQIEPNQRLTQSEHLIDQKKQIKNYLLDETFIFPGTKWRKAKNGGLVCEDKQLIKYQNGVAKSVLARIGKNLLTGKSIINISMPVNIFDKWSFLQRLASMEQMAPVFFDRITQIDNPLLQLKWFIAYRVAKLHYGLDQTKPFNPILGETFQAKFNGSQIYLEQISHHPPISSVLIVGPTYQSFASYEEGVKIYANSVVAKQKGAQRTTFYKNNTTIFATQPFLRLEGTIIGERKINFINKSVLFDLDNNFFCELHFNPDKQGLITGMFKKQQTPKDYFKGTIYQMTEKFRNKVKGLLSRLKTHVKLNACITDSDRNELKPISNIHGIWHDFVEIDGEKFWQMSDDVKPYKLIPQPNPLPSDSFYREDAVVWRNGNESSAQETKENLENLQRRDKKLRQAYQKHA